MGCVVWWEEILDNGKAVNIPVNPSQLAQQASID